jgi:DNA repair exonuclease SbcCD ATPase subunit
MNFSIMEDNLNFLRARVAELENQKLQWESACQANRTDFKDILNDKQTEITTLRADLAAERGRFEQAVAGWQEREQTLDKVLKAERDDLAAELAAKRERATAREREWDMEKEALECKLDDTWVKLNKARAEVAAERERRTGFERACRDAAKALGVLEAADWGHAIVTEASVYASWNRELIAERDTARAEVAALKARKVKLPETPMDFFGIDARTARRAAIQECADAIRAAGVEVES